MANIETTFTDSRTSDVMSDVTTDVNVTLSDVGTVKTISVQLPQGLSLEGLHNPYKKNKRRGTDHNAYFISHLIQRNLYRRKPINEFVPMNSKVLRDVFGGNYAKYIQRLISEGIIEQYSKLYEKTLHNGTVWKHNGTFSIKAGISKQYRLLIDKSTPLVEYKLTDEQLIRKINNARVKKLQHLIKHNETARKVYESIKKVTIDKEAAISYIKEKYQYQGQLQWARWFIGREGHSGKTLKRFINEFLHATTKPKKRKVLEEYGVNQSSSDVSLLDTAVGVIKHYTIFL